MVRNKRIKTPQIGWIEINREGNLVKKTHSVWYGGRPRKLSLNSLFWVTEEGAKRSCFKKGHRIIKVILKEVK